MPEQYVLKDELAKEVVKSMKPNLGGRRVMGNKNSLDIEIKENKILSDLKENSLKQNNHLQKISYSMSAMVGFERDKQRRAKDQQTELARELKRTMARGGAMGGVAGSPKTESGEGGGMGLIGRALSVLGLTSVAKGGVGLLGKMRGTKLGGGTERMFGVNKGYTPRAAKKLGVGGTAKTIGKGSLGGLSKMATGKAGVLSALFAIPSLMLDYSDMKKSQAEGDEYGASEAQESMVGTGGAVAGSLAGAAAGAAIGSVVPVIGTAIGGLIGGLIGGFGGSKLGEGLFKTKAEKEAAAKEKKKKEEELAKKYNYDKLNPKDLSKEAEKAPEMKEAKKGIDMTKKPDLVAHTTTERGKITGVSGDMADILAVERLKLGKTKAGQKSSADFDKMMFGDTFAGQSRELKEGEGARSTEDIIEKDGKKFAVSKTSQINLNDAEQEIAKNGYMKLYNDIFGEYYEMFKNKDYQKLLKNDPDKAKDFEKETFNKVQDRIFGRGRKLSFASSMYFDDMIRNNKASEIINRAQQNAYVDAKKMGTEEAGKTMLDRVKGFFKGFQGEEAGTAGDIAGEAAMQNAAGDQTETQKPGDKKSIFSKFKTALKGLAKVSPVAGAAMAIMDKNKMPEENAQFGEIPEDQSLEGAQFGDMPAETKPKTRADRFLDRTNKLVLNPEDGKYYPPDSPVLKKFKPNELRSVKGILDSGETTQQASAMAVSNNNVNNVSNNSNQNIYTGKLNVDVDNYAERVNDF